MRAGCNSAASQTQERSPFETVRVCHVGPHLPRKGGVSIQTHLTEDGLRRDGAEVISIDTILHKLSHPLLLPLRMLLQPIATALAFLKVGRKCDVVHLQACSWWGFLPVVICAPINKLLFKKRLIITFHGARGHLFLDRYHLAAMPFLRLADEVVVVSPELQGAFKKYGIDARVVGIIINLDAFRFRERPQVRPNIVWMRHLEEMYDPLTALRVFAEVKKQIPEATITFIGGGSLRSQMDQLIEEGALTDVFFTGPLSHQQMAEEFDKADIFLNTSKNDAKPAALLEASAAGLPIVTTAAGGIPDMVEDGTNAVIAPVGDVDALATEVVAVLRDPQRACRLGNAARENAEAYRWSNYSRELAKLYQVQDKHDL